MHDSIDRRRIQLRKCAATVFENSRSIYMSKNLSDIKVGDFVLRWLTDILTPMRLEVMKVTANRIICRGGWEFDSETGAEIDEALGWGPDAATGSFIRPYGE